MATISTDKFHRRNQDVALPEVGTVTFDVRGHATLPDDEVTAKFLARPDLAELGIQLVDEQASGATDLASLPDTPAELKAALLNMAIPDVKQILGLAGFPESEYQHLKANSLADYAVSKLISQGPETPPAPLADDAGREATPPNPVTQLRALYEAMGDDNAKTLLRLHGKPEAEYQGLSGEALVSYATLILANPGAPFPAPKAPAAAKPAPAPKAPAAKPAPASKAPAAKPAPAPKAPAAADDASKGDDASKEGEAPSDADAKKEGEAASDNAASTDGAATSDNAASTDGDSTAND